jgi:hypothetical protein
MSSRQMYLQISPGKYHLGKSHLGNHLFLWANVLRTNAFGQLIQRVYIRRTNVFWANVLRANVLLANVFRANVFRANVLPAIVFRANVPREKAFRANVSALNITS